MTRPLDPVRLEKTWYFRCMHRLLVVALLSSASGCMCTKTIDSTWLHVRSTLTQHWEAVPGLGTSTTYKLSVEGFGSDSPDCSSDSGEISAAPDGKRLAYWCGDSGWHVVYLEHAALLPLCETMSARPHWNEVRMFKEAAVDLALCSYLERFLTIADALEAQSSPRELEAFFVQTFERQATPPAGWQQALLARPAAFRMVVVEHIRRQSPMSDVNWSPQRTSALIEVTSSAHPQGPAMNGESPR